MPAARARRHKKLYGVGPRISARGTAGLLSLGMQTIYEAAGGEGGMLRLARAWHARVMSDEVVSHAFSHGFQPDHTERLAAYWSEVLGGPPAYSTAYGDAPAG